MKNDYHDKHVELRRSENFHRLLLARPGSLSSFWIMGIVCFIKGS
jgi:hypothetical protein